MTLTIPDIDPDAGIIAAALAYADAGWYVLPVDPGTKHPGSVLGKGWPAKTSRDPEVIADWFLLGGYALGLHAGRSGAVVFDVDHPSALPPVLIEALAAADCPHQSTRTDQPGRGHYIYAVPDGRTLGNGTGALGKGWGEVRGRNGIIVVSPSEHAKADVGGRYTWTRTGPVPVLPAALAEALPDSGHTADAATDPEVAAFLAAHTGAARPTLLRAITARFTADVDAGHSRHESMLLPACNAMREARAGMYPAAEAARALQALFVHALTHPRNDNDRAVSPSAANAEWSGILAWAVAQANAAPTDEIAAVQAGIDQRAPDRGHLADLLPPTVPSATTPAPADGDMATIHTLPAPDGEPGSRTSWWPRSLAGVLTGDEEEPPPALLTRDDGVALWYTGKVNGLLGESESGKTWVALLGVAQALAHGGAVAYFDFEDTPAGIVSRLRALGVPDAHIADRLDYIGPDEALHLGAQGDLAEYLDQRGPTLAIVDGVNAAMTLMGLDLNSNTDATRFMHTLLKPITNRGAAVVAVDHVPKSKESRGKGGIGAQAKRAMMTGCAITVEVAEPFGRGMTGRLRLYVDKDRPGFVRAKSAEARFAGTALLESNAGTGEVAVTIRAPQIGEAAPSQARSGAEARTRGLMEAVSTYLSTNPERTSLRGIREAVKGRPADISEAVEALVAEGYVARSGSGNRYTHTLVRPFSTLSDMIVQDAGSTEGDGNRGSGVVPDGSQAVSVTDSENPGVAPQENGHSPQTSSGSVVPDRFPPVPGTTSPTPGGTGSPVPTPIGGNREPHRPGNPTHTPNAAGTGNHPGAPLGAANPAPGIVVIDGRIITTDGAVLERHGDDLIDPATGEVRGTAADLPQGAA